MEVLNSVGQTNATLIFKDVDLKKPASEWFAPRKGFIKCDQDSLMSASWRSGRKTSDEVRTRLGPRRRK
jgi:hypothetical protein